MDMENSLSQKRLITLGRLSNRMTNPDFQSKEEEDEPEKNSSKFLTDPRAVENEHRKLLRQRSFLKSDAEKTSLGKMTTNERDQNTKVSFGTYRRYIMKYFGGWKFLIISNLAIIAYIQCSLLNDYLLGLWTNNKESEEFGMYSALLIGSTFLMSLLTYLRSAGVHLFSWSATKALHEDMVHSTFNAPVNLYFDRTPIARLMNVFSKDLNQLEIQMSYHMSFFMIMFYNMLSIGFIAAMAHIYMIILIPMVIVICLDIVNTTLPAINEASQLTRMTKSPILSHI